MGHDRYDVIVVGARCAGSPDARDMTVTVRRDRTVTRTTASPQSRGIHRQHDRFGASRIAPRHAPSSVSVRCPSDCIGAITASIALLSQSSAARISAAVYSRSSIGDDTHC